MKTNIQAAEKGPSKLDQFKRLEKVKRTLGEINYTTIYSYEYDEVLTKAETDRLRNFWSYKITDLKLLNRFEWIAENIHNIPNIAKQK